MRKRFALLLAAGALAVTTVAWADNTFEGFPIVRVILNQQEVVSDVPAINFFGRTMLPVRKIAELAGLTVDRWDGATSTVYLSSGDALATVNGETISKADLYDRMAKENGAKVMETLIRERLVEQAARQANLTVATADVDAEISKIQQRVGGPEQFQMALRQNNITLEQLRDFQAYRLKVAKLMAPTIPMTDAVLQQFFAENKAQFDTRRVHARHILTGTEADAKAIKAELDKGADFATLAKARSTDPSAQQNGGDLGFFGAGVMVPEFEQAVFALPAGGISAPFQSPFGWHVAQVLEVTGSAPDFAAMRAQVEAAYLDAKVQEGMQTYLNDLRAKATVTNSFEAR